MEFIKKYGKFIILGLLLFLFAFVTRKLLNQSLSGFDTAIYNFISSFRTPFLTHVFLTITFLSSAPFLIILSICLIFIFKNKKYVILSFCNLVTIVLLNQLLKHIFSRSRPFEWMLIQESGYSFPSGHAMVSTAFYGLLIYLIWRTKTSKKHKKILTVFLITLIVLIGISRIYLGVHYASDIIAGFTLSISYLIIVISVIDYYLKHIRK